MTVCVGVDRAGGRWLAVCFEAGTYDHSSLFEEFGDLWQRYEDAERVLVDVPIGLKTDGETSRECDRQARTVLGPRRSSVFSPPVREATRKRRYSAAARVQERKTDTGLSKQAFAIADAIAAVDTLLQHVPEARTVVRESHPEVCFRAFASRPLVHSKHSAAGYAERVEALVSHDNDAFLTLQRVAKATGSNPRAAEVGIDDALDALALAYTAASAAGSLYTLPPEPPTDEAGLPMEIVYRSDAPLATDG